MLFCSYAYFDSGGGWNQDSRFGLTRALVEQHTVKIDSFQSNTGDKAFFEGHFYCDKAPGLSLLAAPVWALVRLGVRTIHGDPASPGVIRLGLYAVGITTVALPTALALASLLAFSVEMGASPTGAVFGAVALGLATPLWCYATLFWGHATAGALLVFAFRLAKALDKPGLPTRALIMGLGVGLAAGWATLVEYPAAPAGGILAAYALVNTWRVQPRTVLQVLSGLFLGAIACAIILGAYNLIAFHSLATVSYKYLVFFPEAQQGVFGITYPKPRAMLKLLGAPYRGLLPLAPELLLILPGFFILWRNARTRWPSLVLCAIPLYYWLLNASYVNWFGGSCYGPRYLSPGLFFLAPALAITWTKSPTAVRALLVALSGVGFALALIAVATAPTPPQSWSHPIPPLVQAFIKGQIPDYATRAFAGGRVPDFSPPIGSLSLGPQDMPNLIPNPNFYAGTNAGILAGLHGIPSLIPLVVMWSLWILAWARFSRVALRAGPSTI
ncbi:MAG: hypothetical protein JOZ14_16085 [Acidobacteria bacterium]|nr:hypothetical protein [Acidobacteriota bacterium]